jgi:diadenosine tetraphosphate (Ap4A) HIT family hydrolase
VNACCDRGTRTVNSPSDGGLLARTQQIIERHLKPKRLYIGRFGHEPGLPLHFHFIPVYAWVEDLFWKDSRFRLLESFA